MRRAFVFTICLSAILAPMTRLRSGFSRTLRHGSSFLFSVALGLLIHSLYLRSAHSEAPLIRVGHFPTVTHAPALVLRALDTAAQSPIPEFEAYRGKIEWFTYDTGAGAVEALLSKSIDLSYVGPSPLLAAQSRYGENTLRILAGVTTGGSALVVNKDTGIGSAQDLRGKRIATPQIGNTQDVACRTWLGKAGFHITQQGGDVLVFPTSYANQLMLLRSGELDGSWAVEPWVSRFELELGASILYSDVKSVTTVIATSGERAVSHRQILGDFVALNRAVIRWINQNPDQAKTLVSKQIASLTHRAMPQPLIDRAWPRLSFDPLIDAAALETAANDTFATKLIRRPVILATLLDPL